MRSRSSMAVAASAVTSPYQTARALNAPPEVPLMPTSSKDSPSESQFASSSRSTPAVKAVWLPPPWQAMATVVGSVSASVGSVAGDIVAGLSATVPKGVHTLQVWNRSRKEGLAEEFDQQRLLGVEPVFGLLPDDGAVAFEHRIGDLLAAVGGQTVHHL